MLAFDTSAIVYGWDNYPISQFPRFWDWLATEVAIGRVAFPSVVLEEVSSVAPDCHMWLVESGVQKIEMTNSILQDALRIKAALGISGDRYHAKGVGENDLFIIATARSSSASLVSNEGRQQVSPDIAAKRRIPSVCELPTVAVECFDFLGFIKRSRGVF